MVLSTDYHPVYTLTKDRGPDPQFGGRVTNYNEAGLFDTESNPLLVFDYTGSSELTYHLGGTRGTNNVGVSKIVDGQSGIFTDILMSISNDIDGSRLSKN